MQKSVRGISSTKVAPHSSEVIEFIVGPSDPWVRNIFVKERATRFPADVSQHVLEVVQAASFIKQMLHVIKLGLIFAHPGLSHWSEEDITVSIRKPVMLNAEVSNDIGLVVHFVKGRDASLIKLEV